MYDFNEIWARGNGKSIHFLKSSKQKRISLIRFLGARTYRRKYIRKVDRLIIELGNASIKKNNSKALTPPPRQKKVLANKKYGFSVLHIYAYQNGIKRII